MSDPTLLPGRESLNVEQSKIVGYLLNLASRDGAAKARFFQAHGYTVQAWTVLADALRAHGTTRPVVDTRQSSFGVKFILSCAIDTPDGRNPCIVTVWIVEGQQVPRLVTAYPQ